MIKAPPTAPLEMVQPELILELLIVALDAPAELGQADEGRDRGHLRQSREPILRGRAFAPRPLDEQPFFRPGLRALRIAMGRSQAQPREAGTHRAAGPFAPRYRPPRRRRNRHGQPRPFQRFGGRGPAPGGHAVVSPFTPTTYGSPALVRASRNAVVSP